MTKNSPQDSTAPSTPATEPAAAPGGGGAPKPASHDTPPPEALVKLMLSSWKPASPKTPAKLAHAEVFAARRRALSKQFAGITLVVPTGHERYRSNDTTYPFRPGSDFYYLTGNTEPDCVLVLVARPGGGHTDVLFVEPNPGRSDPTFFTNRAKGELWVGPRLGVEESRARFAVDECRGLPELASFVTSVREGGRPSHLVRGLSETLDTSLPTDDGDKKLAEALSEMRLVKDALELRELRAAVASTKLAYEDVIRALKSGGTERHAEAAFDMRARVEGNGVGYGTIAAAGHHACILHWTRNDGPLDPKELLLVDAGVEGRSLYTADITRALPIGGKFSKEQRVVYELVLSAHTAALAEVKPGNDFLDPHKAAMRVFAHGLEELGLLADAELALRDDQQLYKRYTLHNTSHMLGLDVHDCAKARPESYKLGKLRKGMVLTIEPGLYFQRDDLTVPARYRGIGVRIEDDVLVTAKGYENLSVDIPRAADDVEKWIARIWRGSDKGARRK